MKPYFERDGVTLYHGDCREGLGKVEADVLVTDPPYGVELGRQKDWRGRSHGLAKRGYDLYEDTHENFVRIVAPAIVLALSRVKRGAVFCAGPNIQDLPRGQVGGIYCKATTA